jgi:hypothetical protein
MEIVEIISSYINKENNIIRVEFKMNEDEGVRQDIIEFEYIKDFGYYEDDLIDAFGSINDEDDDWDDWDVDDEETYIDDDILISFLNEYYIVFPDRIPEEE